MSPAGQKNYLTDWVWIETLSQDLLNLASQENWDELQKLAEDRNRCLKEFFVQDIPAEYAQDIAAGINRIKELDERLTTMAQESKEQIRREQLAMSKIKSVQKAYNDNKQ